MLHAGFHIAIGIWKCFYHKYVESHIFRQLRNSSRFNNLFCAVCLSQIFYIDGLHLLKLSGESLSNQFSFICDFNFKVVLYSYIRLYKARFSRCRCSLLIFVEICQNRGEENFSEKNKVKVLVVKWEFLNSGNQVS